MFKPTYTTCRAFLEESNRIEGITTGPFPGQIGRFQSFLELPQITVAALEDLARTFQPDAVLRDQPGLDVSVGRYVPPCGGPDIRDRLEAIVSHATNPNSDPWEIHVAFESLHPFTDCNGRTGRALWAWQMKEFPLLFLHSFYYQTLQHSHLPPVRGYG